VKSISAAYLERKLRAVVGLIGGNPIPELGDIQGFVVLESDRPEWRFPGGESSWGVTESIAAGGAGTFAQMVLINRPASGVLIVVEDINFVASSSIILSILSGGEAGIDAALATLEAGVPRDARLINSDNSLQRSGADVRSGVSATIFGADFYRGAGTANRGDRYPFPIILRPSSSLAIRDSTAVQAMDVSIAWRERPLEGGVQMQ